MADDFSDFTSASMASDAGVSLPKQSTPQSSSVSQVASAQQQGLDDIKSQIKQMQAQLPDIVPGSPTHQRLMASLAEAQGELARYGQQSVAPASKTPADDFSDFTSKDVGTPPEAPSMAIEASGMANGQSVKPSDVTIPGQPSNAVTQNEPGAFEKYVVGPLEAGLTTASGMVAQPVGAIAGLGYGLTHDYGTPQGVQNADRFGADIANSLTYKPVTQTGQNDAQAVSGALDSIGLSALAPILHTIPVEAGIAGAGEAARRIGSMPGEGMPLNQIGKPATVERIEPTMNGSPSPSAQPVAAAGQGSQMGVSGGAAGVNLDTAFAGAASPELRAAYAQAKASGNPINVEAAQRHLQADSLPVPVRLTAGQATQDIHLLSDEFNNRGKVPGIADRLAQQGEQLKENLDAIKDQVAPDVYHTNPVESGQSLIDAYKNKDADLRADINQKYQALRDANGGDFPIDAQTFVANADAALKQSMKTDFVPPAIAKQLDAFRNGDPMNFEQFEAMRTNLANEIRKAERSGDGNAAYASGLVRNALEDLPMTGEAANLKPLADAARSAAKARFDLLDNDPAYKAAVNDTTSADKFIDKFVIRGSKADVQTMRANLGGDDLAGQTIAAGAMNWLKEKSGIINGRGNFSQAGYNRALHAIGPKIGDLVGGGAAQTLSDLGDVANYTIGQKRGTYFNNSGTLVGALRSGAADALERASNVHIGPVSIPVGSTIRGLLDKRAISEQAQSTLQPGAGLVKLNQLPK